VPRGRCTRVGWSDIVKGEQQSALLQVVMKAALAAPSSCASRRTCRRRARAGWSAIARRHTPPAALAGCPLQSHRQGHVLGASGGGGRRAVRPRRLPQNGGSGSLAPLPGALTWQALVGAGHQHLAQPALRLAPVGRHADRVSGVVVLGGDRASRGPLACSNPSRSGRCSKDRRWPPD
jgi:hypothetical protein